MALDPVTPRPPSTTPSTPVQITQTFSPTQDTPPSPTRGPSPAEVAEKTPEKGSAAFFRVRYMKRVRDVELREGKSAKDLTWSRIANHEAVLGYTRGVVEEGMCKQCEQSGGPFAECVTVPGEYTKSCTNCHYNSNGKQCSFRADKGKCKRKRSPSLEILADPDDDFAPPRTKVARTRKGGRGAEFGKHWDNMMTGVVGVASIVRDLIIEKVL
ncbi:hypothetical protein L873DRAFT_1874745, partial [Choiromyces venosus 120613-1]